MTSNSSAPKIKVKVFPKYMYVGTPLKGEIEKMNAGQREDFFVENLSDFLHQFCDHKKWKMLDVSKLIQSELNKLYKGKTDDKTMLAVLNKRNTETDIWDTISKTLGCLSYSQYLLYSLP